jgi:hypothetical protein
MLTDRDLSTLKAAASLARHAPEALRAAHLAPKLEVLAERTREAQEGCPCGSPICPRYQVTP